MIKNFVILISINLLKLITNRTMTSKKFWFINDRICLKTEKTSLYSKSNFTKCSKLNEMLIICIKFRDKLFWKYLFCWMFDKLIVDVTFSVLIAWMTFLFKKTCASWKSIKIRTFFFWIWNVMFHTHMKKNVNFWFSVWNIDQNHFDWHNWYLFHNSIDRFKVFHEIHDKYFTVLNADALWFQKIIKIDDNFIVMIQFLIRSELFFDSLVFHHENDCFLNWSATDWFRFRC